MPAVKKWTERLDARTDLPVSVTEGMCNVCNSNPPPYGATFVGSMNPFVTQDVWKAKSISDTNITNHIRCNDITQHCKNKAYSNAVGWRK